MYERILVPLDGSEFSERVLPVTSRLARDLALPVSLLHAIEPEHPTISQALNERLYYIHSARHRETHARAYTEPVRTRLMESGLSVDITIPQGDPGDVIVEEADRDPGTLITMSSHGRSGASRWWTGSVADRVLHRTASPLLMIRPGGMQGAAAVGEFGRIVVPVDGSELAEQALDHAVHLGKSMGLVVELVRAVPSVEEYNRIANLGPASMVSQAPSYAEYRAVVEKEAVDYLAELAGRLKQDGAQVDWRVLHGPAAAAIIDHSAASEDALLVMTTHGRSGLVRMVLGSVAERVVRQSGEPVLLIRAKG